MSIPQNVQAPVQLINQNPAQMIGQVIPQQNQLTNSMLDSSNMIIQTPDSAIIPKMPNMIPDVDNALLIPGSSLGQQAVPGLTGNKPQLVDTQQAPNLVQTNQNMYNRSMSPEAQLMGVSNLTAQAKEEPQLLNKPVQPKKKPFAQQKFFSGTVGK
jgi:hypothetical protein